MNKILLLTLLSVISVVSAYEYSVYAINGKKLGATDCEKVSECFTKGNRNYKQAMVFVEKKNALKSIKTLASNAESLDTFNIVLEDIEQWIEVEKNQVYSLCIDASTSGNWFVSGVLFRMQNEKCIQIQSGNEVNSSKVMLVADNGASYVFNILVGEKYIDLSKTTHLLGFNGSDFSLKNPVIYSDVEENYNNRIYLDPERKESINEVLIVDKYLVTNCDVIQVLWDSIPRSSMSKNNNMTRYHNYWIERKERMVKDEKCDTHDSAAIKLYLYDALIYANARSIRDGFEPVYKFEKIKQSNYIPSLYENGDFDVYTMSFFEKYEESDFDWLKVKVDKNANGYRLPYYNEWMALARGGTANRRYIWGEDVDSTVASQYAWFGTGKAISEKFGVYEQDSRPVGMLKPNAYGLYDVLGLVCENVMLPGKSLFAREITSCKGGFLYDSLKNLNFGAHEDNWNAGYGGYQGLRLVRQIK